GGGALGGGRGHEVLLETRLRPGYAPTVPNGARRSRGAVPGLTAARSSAGTSQHAAEESDQQDPEVPEQDTDDGSCGAVPAAPRHHRGDGDEQHRRHDDQTAPQEEVAGEEADHEADEQHRHQHRGHRRARGAAACRGAGALRRVVHASRPPRAPAPRSSSASARQTFENSPRWSDSSMLWARDSGSSTPVTSTSACGNTSSRSAMNGMEPPRPVSTAGTPQARSKDCLARSIAGAAWLAR